MPPRPPSGPQLRSAIRGAERKALREMQGAIRKAERDVTSEFRRSERRMTRELDNELRRSERKVLQELDKVAHRQQRELSRRATRRNVSYTSRERAYLTTVREAVEADNATGDRAYDAFLCHAWADREHAATEFHVALCEEGVHVWFSENDLILGTNLPRELDRGIACSHVGIVLVTQAMLAALRTGGFAEHELGALLSTGRVVPVCHQVTYDQLKSESPLLASRAGLSTEGSSFSEVAAKIADSLLDPR